MTSKISTITFIFYISLLELMSFDIKMTFANTPPTPLMTLEDSFQAGVKKSELVSDQDQQILQAEEKVSQAKGNLLPNVSGTASYFLQETPSDPLTQSFFPSGQPNIKLTLSQPIFRGLREFAGLRQTRSLVEAQRSSKGLTLFQLYNDICINFYTLLAYQEEIKNLESQLALYQDRIRELKQRTNTGQSSATETLTAQASQAVVEAQIRQIRGKYKSTWEYFSFLTGFPVETPLNASETEPKNKVSLSDYLGTIEKRPDIQAAKERMDASEEAVTIAKGAHLPSVDFLANYYLLRPPGVFREIRWDLQATLTLPLYSGGTLQSQVNDSTSKRAQADLNLARTRKLAVQEIRSLYENYESDLEQIQALEQSVNLNEKNYLVLKRDYLRGLTRNIEVLQGLTQFQESKRALANARWSLKSNWNRLQVLSAFRSLPEVRK